MVTNIEEMYSLRECGAVKGLIMPDLKYLGDDVFIDHNASNLSLCTVHPLIVH